MKIAIGLAVVVPVLAVLSAPKVARAEDATEACISASEHAVADYRAGKLVEARTALSACSASTCPEVVRNSCQQRLAQVERAVPRIVLAVKDPAGRDLKGVKLSIDGHESTARFDAVPIELDPGAHDFRFEVAGESPVTRNFVLHPGEQDRRETVVIGDAKESPSGPVQDEPAPVSPGAGSTQRTIGLVLGSVGAAGLVAGGIFGALSIAAHSSYEKNCGSSIGAAPNECNPTGVNGESDASTKGTVSTVAFIAGGALLATGAALFVLAPRGAIADAQASVGLGSFSIRGSF